MPVQSESFPEGKPSVCVVRTDTDAEAIGREMVQKRKAAGESREADAGAARAD